MRRRPAEALLIDFDGVLRHFDPAAYGDFESRHGVAPAKLLESGLEWARQLPAITGHWTRQQWLDEIAAHTGASAAALTEWDAYPGYVDEAVLGFVREVRAAGRRVGLATNATDDLYDDLALLGLTDEFDAIVSSAELGLHKPSKEFFKAACLALETPADRCLFLDDTDRNIRGARAAGLSALRWDGPAALPYARAALNL
ncbi:hydrolase [Catellatospora methionotrophica]|uniref:Hydrolase n=1 Tax=Catellatospora methionotrophica TaxID=121620 RepID=A0A8J3PHX6_9ACTN|nr:HAD-IA family hydrolase [Catellatospora methionotrophica]GIG17852.1 hydrolase [Catellatospora methionotrophica]